MRRDLPTIQARLYRLHNLPHGSHTRGGDRTRRTGNGQAVTAAAGAIERQARQEHARGDRRIMQPLQRLRVKHIMQLAQQANTLQVMEGQIDDM